MSGGRPLPPQTVGGIEVQLHEMSGGHPLPVSAPPTVGAVEVQLRGTSGGHPLRVSAPQTVGGVETQRHETVVVALSLCLLLVVVTPFSKLSIHFKHCRVVGAPLLLEVIEVITVLWIAYLRAVDQLQTAQ